MIPAGYISGLGRDYPHPRVAHLYRGTFAEPGLPMCPKGWNRDEGQTYSIWRNNEGERGICAVCMRRALKGLPGIPPLRPARPFELNEPYAREFEQQIAAAEAELAEMQVSVRDEH